MKKFATSATLCFLAFSAPGLAQQTTETVDHSTTSGAMDSFMKVMDTLMQRMPKESSGKVDADFMLMMIPHHQSAIDMAKVELEQGTDDETKALAQKMIDAQEKEIGEMRQMLERMGVTPPAME